MFQALRLAENPLVHPGLSPRIGLNINGPSLIRVPDWVEKPLGRYYLYFAHHQGEHIRLAYADQVRGPWTVHEPGVLDLADTACLDHIASPDAHVDAAGRRVILYFHGVTPEGQRSFRAVSEDGLRFRAERVPLGPFYFRVFEQGGAYYAIAKRTEAPGGGILLHSPDGIAPFEPGPFLLPNMRHAALWKQGDRLHVFYSRGEDCPERILHTILDLRGDWRDWRTGEATEILRPETGYEGADLPLRPSRFGAIHEPAHELRDPAIFEEDGRLILLYTGAGESCICGAELLPL